MVKHNLLFTGFESTESVDTVGITGQCSCGGWLDMRIHAPTRQLIVGVRQDCPAVGPLADHFMRELQGD